MIIRREKQIDEAAIRDVVVAAFGQALEAELVDDLRESGEVEFVLVAEDEGELIGHVLASGLQAPDERLALAPVSVMPHRQNQGVGSQLILNALEVAKRAGWKAVFLLGEPAYYERFGFSVAAASKFHTEYPKSHFMALELVPGALKELGGDVVYARPFLALR